MWPADIALLLPPAHFSAPLSFLRSAYGHQLIGAWQVGLEGRADTDKDLSNSLSHIAPLHSCSAFVTYLTRRVCYDVRSLVDADEEEVGGKSTVTPPTLRHSPSFPLGVWASWPSPSSPALLRAAAQRANTFTVKTTRSFTSGIWRWRLRSHRILTWCFRIMQNFADVLYHTV